MQQIKITDTQFAHGTSLGSGSLNMLPKYFEWYRGDNNINDMVIITESMFHKLNDFSEKIKIAWLLEPQSIDQSGYNFVKNHCFKFDYVLSHNLDFINELQQISNLMKKTDLNSKDTKICWYPFGGCWILPEDRKIYPKSKLISIIASDKKETVGHKMRHEAIAALGDKVDVFGRGYNPVDYKLDALKDYRYSIVIENEKTNGWFTEKLIDCYVTGTIPIYWGNPLVKDNFVVVKPFQTIDQLIRIVNIIENRKLDDILFEKPLPYDLNRAQEFACPEDWLFINFFMKNKLI